jgi:predicted transcriptional regulator
MPDIELQKFAKRLSMAIKALGYTKNSFAKTLDKGQATLNRATLGTIEPRVSLLFVTHKKIKKKATTHTLKN